MTASSSAPPHGRRPSRWRRRSRQLHQLREEAAALPIHVRADALAKVSRAIAERAEEIAQLVTAENGKPILWARAEVGRAVSVFRLAAEEARRWSGEAMRLDTDKTAEGRLAYVRQRPQGRGAGDLAVQLPPEPGGPQGRTGHRSRRPGGPQAGSQDTPVSLGARRDHR
ncbi:MAG: aldehyde dehydrogenase family protein [Nocardioidaceae bacterium]